MFVDLLENSVVNGRAPYVHALEQSKIQYSELLKLARKAEVPHPLFFAPPAVVQAQLRTKTTKLLQGVAPDTFTVNTRTTVKLRDVELIVKDLLRKQELARKHDPTLVKNKIIGLLRKPRPTVREDAEALIKEIGLDRDAIRQARKKETALELIVERLEANQVLVSRSVRGYMPQLIEVHFSGMTVRDSKLPYIFLTGGDHGDFQEPHGRQIFTLVLMAVLVARGIFAPVSYDANSTAPDAGREYDIVGEILMPAAELQRIPFEDLDDVKAAADLFKVTPSAVAVRAMRLGRLSPLTATGYLRELEEEFRARNKPSRTSQPKPVNAVKKYSGRELTARMLRAVEEGRLSQREFCRVVCLNRIGPSDIGELKAALR
ncbi:DNA-binding protein [Arthrobacter sp. LjRoot14]|uniref:DNA-binding protein n=1 Tax=Arthrobacter sp. LjRoot14 TaxID=3342265 RepID=UPI003F506808